MPISHKKRSNSTLIGQAQGIAPTHHREPPYRIGTMLGDGRAINRVGTGRGLLDRYGRGNSHDESGELPVPLVKEWVGAARRAHIIGYRKLRWRTSANRMP